LAAEQFARQPENDSDDCRPPRKPPVYRNFLLVAVIRLSAAKESLDHRFRGGLPGSGGQYQTNRIWAGTRRTWA
jgi:hypothetical protein